MLFEDCRSAGSYFEEEYVRQEQDICKLNEYMMLDLDAFRLNH